MTEDKMVGWHHRLNGHEFEQTPRDGEGQGSLVCCSPWGSQRVGHSLANEQQQPCLINPGGKTISKGKRSQANPWTS